MQGRTVHSQLASPSLEVFGYAVDAANRYEGRASVHRPHDFAQVPSQQIRPPGSRMPDGQDGHICCESTCLKDEGCLDQYLARLVLSGTYRSVRGFRSAVGYHELNEKVNTDERSQDTAWVER